MYNCADQISKVYTSLKQFRLQFDSNIYSIEKIIFLDNHSQDNTVGTIKELIKDDPLCSVGKNNENYGLGGSHKSLFLYAQSVQAQHVVIVHGDNQAEARELVNIFKLSELNNCCTVLGARFMDLKFLVGYSVLRTLGNRVLNLIYSFVLKQKIYDLGSGLNLFNISDINFERVLLFDDRFTFNMDLLIYLLNQKMQVKFVPITWRSEDEISNVKIFEVGQRALFKIIKWSLFKEKIWQGSLKKYIFKVV